VGEALDELEKEEAEPKLKKKKAPLQMKSSMVEMTPAKAKMAKEYAADEIADRKEKKKIIAASIPTKKRNIEETDVSKKKAAAPIFTPMMEVTSDMKMEADE
jgi:hypothetical protein